MVQNLEVKSPGLLLPTLALLLSIERCTLAPSSLFVVEEVGRLAAGGAGGAVFFFLGFVRKQACFFFWEAGKETNIWILKMKLQKMCASFRMNMTF